ncbi:MAG: class I SAM-dependent methyltransferase [Bacteroidota bacterium]|nr:class I SAM-dependent methyltransferase [Bacteroidota bacterium]
MDRILEPEVMDTMEDAIEYDAMDFTEVNTSFAERAVEILPDEGLVLDLGTGSARIPILILQRNRKLKIIAVDLSENMLKVGKMNVDTYNFSASVELIIVDAKKLPYPDNHFDAVISNSLLHHIPDPLPVLKEINRVSKSKAGILIRDLIRPESFSIVEALVQQYAGDCDEHQKKLFRDSLIASFTIDEVKILVEQSGIKDSVVIQSSDRHLSIEKVFTNNYRIS